MKITQDFLTPNRWSRPQTKLNGVKGIVIHWTANANSTAKGNRNFFENRKHGKTNFGSAHYIVGLEGEIIQCLPDSELGYHVGSHVYTSHARVRLGAYPNNCTLGIECTHIDNKGKMTDDTYENTLELAVSLLRKYKLTENDLWLHQTVVGWKDCHRYFVNNNDEWIKFKTLAGEMLRGKANLNVEVNTRDIVIVDDYTPASNILKLGSKGNKVTDLQKKLIAAGESLLKYGSDGDFGKETEDAVISFQRKMNISVDGIVGNETLKALEKAIADLNKVKVETKTETKKEVVDPVVKGVEVKSSRPTIRLTSPLTKNEHVEVVQRAVGAKVDGYFGKQTENKVKVYQKVNGLHSDGIVGKNTWNVIDNPKPTTKPTPTPSKATSSIKSIGKIQIVNVANAAIIMDSPDKHKANNIGLLRKGSKIDICGSVTGKHNPQGYWEVIFKGKRGYVSGQFGKRV